MSANVLDGHGVQQEKPLNGDQAQVLRPAAQPRLGGQHPVRHGVAGDEVGGDLPGSQAIHQIQMDEHPFPRLVDPAGHVPNGEHIPIEQEDHGNITFQSGGQASLILDRRDHRPVGQQLQQLQPVHGNPLFPPWVFRGVVEKQKRAKQSQLPCATHSLRTLDGFMIAGPAGKGKGLDAKKCLSEDGTNFFVRIWL